LGYGGRLKSTFHPRKIDNGKLKARVYDEEVIFNVFEAINYPNDEKDCF